MIFCLDRRGLLTAPDTEPIVSSIVVDSSPGGGRSMPHISHVRLRCLVLTYVHLEHAQGLVRSTLLSAGRVGASSGNASSLRACREFLHCVLEAAVGIIDTIGGATGSPTGKSVLVGRLAGA